MTRPTTHALLGEIHTILGRYRKEDFLEASRYRAVTKPVKLALHALARELNGAGSAPANELSTGRSPRKPSRRDLPQDWSRESSSVLGLLKRSPYFDSSQSLVDFAKNLGFKLQAKPKDSRDRLARRLAAYIESLHDEARDRILSDLLASRNSQTHGWVNVIKSSR